jgi:hypothetical protein
LCVCCVFGFVSDWPSIHWVDAIPQAALPSALLAEDGAVIVKPLKTYRGLAGVCHRDLVLAPLWWFEATEAVEPPEVPQLRGLRNCRGDTSNPRRK